MDQRLRDLAQGSPNFGILYPHQPLLSIFGALAEATMFTNPNSSLVQAGQFGEVLPEELITRVGMRIDGDRQIDWITALTRAGILARGHAMAASILADGSEPGVVDCGTCGRYGWSQQATRARVQLRS